MSEKLNLILRKIIREELRTELSIFKSEILNEIRKGPMSSKPIVEHSNRTAEPLKRAPAPKKSIPTMQKPKPKYSSNPILQSLLEDTEPLYNPVSKDELIQAMRGNLVEDVSGEYESDFDDGLDEILSTNKPAIVRSVPNGASSGISSIVTEDTSGAPVNTHNPTVKNVLDILNNTDYRSKLKIMDEAAKNFRQTGS